jgi:hypothetical protein
MATWRRIALELFPDLEQELRTPLSSPYLLFMELVPRMHQAARDEDEETLRTIFSFAEWALHQPDNDVHNSAGVSFYEHVFDGPPRDWSVIVEWISPHAGEQVVSLWETMLQPSHLAAVRELLRRRTRHRYPIVSAVWDGVPPARAL